MTSETVGSREDAAVADSRVLLVAGSDGGLDPSTVERALAGATVVAERDETDALNRVGAGDGFDCVVASQSPSGPDGIQLLQVVREKYPDLPFVLVVPPDADWAVEAALTSGATDVVTLGDGGVADSLLPQRVRGAIVRADGGTTTDDDRRRDAEGTRTADDGGARWDALAAFGGFALGAPDVTTACGRATRVVADALDTEYVAALELGEDAFELRGAVGWTEEPDGSVTASASVDGLGGRALASGEPAVEPDRATGEWSAVPTLRPDREVHGGLAVPVGPSDGPWGVLEVLTTDGGPPPSEDVAFVRGVAAALSTALARQRFESASRRAVDRAPLGYAELDAEWRFTALNDRAAALLGRDERELVGESLFDAFPAGFESRLRREFRAVSGTDEPASLEAAYPPSGARFELHAYASNAGPVVWFEDVTERTAWERRRRLSELVATTQEGGFFVLDGEMRFVAVDDEFVAVTGRSREELLGAHLSNVIADGPRAAAGALRRELTTEGRGFLRTELTVERADGGRTPVAARFAATTPDRDGFAGVVGTVRDVAERERHERTLTALADAVRELGAAETDVEVCERVGRAATDLLDRERATVYRFDEDGNVLRPVTTSRPAAGDAATPPPVGPADGSPVWEAFVGGEPAVTDGRVVEPNRAVQGATRRSVVLPLNGYGVLLVDAAGEEAVDGRTRRLTSLLAAMAEAAFDRVALAGDLRERETALSSRADRLDRLDRAFDTLLGVGRARSRAGTREEFQQAVCEELVGDGRFDFAWIGTFDATHERLVPRAWAGTERGYVDAVSLVLGEDRTEPAIRAARTGDRVLVPNVAHGGMNEQWRRELLDRGYRSVLSLPLRHGDTLYGVLTVCADDPGAFDEPSDRLFEGVATATANGLDAWESRRALLSDSVVELDVRIPESNDLPSRIAAGVGGRVTFEGAVPHSDGTSMLYLSVSDVPLESVLTYLEESVAVEHASSVVDSDDGLIVVTVAEPTIVSHVTGFGGAIRELTATGGETRLRVELPQPADVRGFVESLRAEHAGAELLARRSRERPLRSRQTFGAELEELLTDRQLEVLRTAYLNGYFEWPRANTGEEIADRLGITQPTFNNHLRVAERKLLTLLLEER
ncbi:bacterio-opsin activator domain-containing protein [Halorarum salinum]|uniref:GAF domain-containing protein n=1 Tax=Halorarum salinum TaxID=2743089 RepID=A0A7D5QI54_9EURY|nr:bacterio-opsin activator domain-containing protein [Halobaculum salinum]QLG60385.1 GAF domain-containing protein [Halobaculum salinum]